MTELKRTSSADQIVKLLLHYSFDLDGWTADQLAVRWLNDYQIRWIRLAIIEALYQGRYKAFSVEQILGLWWRRNQPLCHFTNEFERIICGSSPQSSLSKSLVEATNTAPTPKTSIQNTDIKVQQVSSSELPLVEEVPCIELAGLDQSIPNSKQRMQPEFEKSQELASSTFSSALPSNHQLYQANWERSLAGQHPIHQFIPATETSTFCSKLKAVAQVPAKVSS